MRGRGRGRLKTRGRGRGRLKTRGRRRETGAVLGWARYEVEGAAGARAGEVGGEGDKDGRQKAACGSDSGAAGGRACGARARTGRRRERGGDGDGNAAGTAAKRVT